jgi:hypothetical protein
MIGCMKGGRGEDRTRSRFVPRVTLTVLSGLAVFLLSAGIYVLPVLLEPAPPGAIADWHKERVIARMEGKVPYFLLGSFLGVALLSIRGLLPGVSPRGRT